MNKYYRSFIDATIQVQPVTKELFTKAIAEYLDEDKPDTSMWYDKQPDLLYVLSILASEGTNKNWDTLLRKILIESYRTPINKFVDYEHDPEGDNPKNKNPEGYQIVGHIYDSKLALQSTGEVIPKDCIVIDEGDKQWFKNDSKWRNQPLDIQVAWVLYQYQYPELAELVLNNSKFNPTGFGVSMEILFSDYKFRVGAYDVCEDFDYDATKFGAIEAKKDTPLGNKLQELWEKKLPYQGKVINRIMGGHVFFSGMGIVNRRGNARSENLAIAHDHQYIDLSAACLGDNQLLNLMKSIASKSDGFDLSKCEIIDGKPDCNCIQGALAMETETLDKEIMDLSVSMAELELEFDDAFAAIKKRKDVNPKSGVHKYGDVKFADPKNKKYPIDTESHIVAAFRYFSKQKNKNKYNSKDQKTIMSNIVRAWKKMIDPKGPPSLAKGSEDFPLNTKEEIMSSWAKFSREFLS